jgi:hypothetical protein
VADYDLSEDAIKQKYHFARGYVRVGPIEFYTDEAQGVNVCYQSLNSGKRFYVYAIDNEVEETGYYGVGMFLLGMTPGHQNCGLALKQQVYEEPVMGQEGDYNEWGWWRIPYFIRSTDGETLVFKGALSDAEAETLRAGTLFFVPETEAWKYRGHISIDYLRTEPWEVVLKDDAHRPTPALQLQLRQLTTPPPPPRTQPPRQVPGASTLAKRPDTVSVSDGKKQAPAVSQEKMRHTVPNLLRKTVETVGKVTGLTSVVRSPARPSDRAIPQVPGRHQQPAGAPAGLSLLGYDQETDQPVFVPKAARRQGTYLIGLQGTGKSGLLENLIDQDIKQGTGVCVIDPHGELIDHIIARLPGKAEDRVILLDIEKYRYPFGFNIFACPDPTDPLEYQRTFDRVKHVFEKLLGVSTETRQILEYLENCAYVLIANQGYTMADIELLLTDKHCRQRLLAQVNKPQVLRFWQDYEAMPPSEQRIERRYILRRVNELLLQELALPIVSQSTTTIGLQRIMDEGKILLVKLSPRYPYVTDLIGSLLVALLLNAAYNRLPGQKRQFHVYADEFERFATEDFAELLEQARKYGIGITIAHQNRSQLSAANTKLETDLKDRSRSAGTLIVFRINSKDAEDLAGERNLTPPPFAVDLIDIEDGTRDIETPMADPLHFLLHQGSHNNPRVNEFVQKLRSGVFEEAMPILTTLFARANQGTSVRDVFLHDWEKTDFLKYVLRGWLGRSGLPGLYRMHQYVREEEEWRQELLPLYFYSSSYYDYIDDGLFLVCHQVPIDKKPGYYYRYYHYLGPGQVIKLPDGTYKGTLYRNSYEEPMYKPPYHNLYEYPSRTSESDYTGWGRVYRLLEAQKEQADEERVLGDTLLLDLFLHADDPQGQAFKDASMRFEKFVRPLYRNWYRLRPRQVWGFLEGKVIRIWSQDIHPDLNKQTQEDAWMFIRKVAKDYPYLRLDERFFVCIQREHKIALRYNCIVSSTTEEYHLNEWAVMIDWSIADEMVEGEVDKAIASEKAFVEQFLIDLASVLTTLARDPIGSRSGLKQPDIRKHPVVTQYSTAEMKGRVANEFSSLPLFTAWVKLSEPCPQNPGKKCLSCNLLNPYGVLTCRECGTLLPAQNEYIIRTIKPKEGLYGRALQDRLARIQKGNIQDGYLRRRENVEAEMRQRQARCSQMPQQLTQPATKPPEEEPPAISRRIPRSSHLPP